MIKTNSPSTYLVLFTFLALAGVAASFALWGAVTGGHWAGFALVLLMTFSLCGLAIAGSEHTARLDQELRAAKESHPKTSRIQVGA